MKELNKFVYFLVGLNLIPHLFDMPVWVTGASFTFLAWRVATDFTRVPSPGKWGTIVIAVVFTLLIVNHYGTFIGDEASTATLLIMVSLKTFEMRGYRDLMVLTYLCYFLLMTKLIVSQSIGMTVFMVMDILLITAFMMMYHSPVLKQDWRKLLRKAGSLTLQGAPLILILFFVFPRFTASLWSKNNAATRLSGFSGQLNPGEVSSLVLSEEPAFRVYFSDFSVMPAKMYWRGTVLTQSFGLQWRPSPVTQRPDYFRGTTPLHELIRYEIFLEPHGKKWLFALDWPVSLQSSDNKTERRYVSLAGKTYESRRSLAQREYYVGYSETESNLQTWLPLSENEKSRYLNVEGEDSPQALALAKDIESQHEGATGRVEALLQYFVENKFVYSLNAPQMSTLDEFLFEHRRGFCEHYAASFATLLRWAGVPSRVVVGYQGGTASFLSDYVLVRQLDAHAWVEYWYEPQNTWKRVDPTGVVAPERIQLGAQDFNERFLRASTGSGPTDMALNRWFSDDLKQSLFRMRMVFDQAEAAWMSLLLRYDFTYQQALFSDLGFDNVKRWQLFTFSGVGLVGLLIFVSLRLSRAKPSRPIAQRLYSQLCLVLAKEGLPRRANEGPLSYKSRALEAFPHLRQPLEAVFTEILTDRYGPPQAAELRPPRVKKRISELRSHLKASKLTPS